VGDASGLPDNVHYKNPARQHHFQSFDMNTLFVKKSCSISKIMLQNFLTQVIGGLGRRCHAIFVSIFATSDQSPGATGLGLGFGWARLGLGGLVL
jgi:hypothetical protein